MEFGIRGGSRIATREREVDQVKRIGNLGRRLCGLVAMTAIGLVGCNEDVGTRQARVGAGPEPTMVAGLPPVARSASGAASAAEASAVVPGPRSIDPASVDLQSGHAYWVQLPPEWLPFASDLDHPERSTLVVEEDGVALGPGNVPLVTVQNEGRGSFLHWGVWIYFSSSDNSDPRSNGRAYRVALRP